MVEWARVPFGQLYAEPSRNGLMAPRSVRGSGVALVNMRELFAQERLAAPAMELAPVPGKDPSKWLLKPGDLLFARQSLTVAGAGKCVLVMPATIERTFESHIIRVRLDKNSANSEFFYYFFRSQAGRQAMETIVEAVAAAGIRASDLSRLDVPLPPLDEQRRIALVLSSLDDLIDINERLAKGAVALAREVFSARFPGFAEPDSAKVPFTDYVEVISGGTPKTSERSYWDGDIPWFSIVDAPGENQPWVLRTTKSISRRGLDNSPTNLLPVGATILSARGTVGKVALVGTPMTMNQSCYALKSKIDTAGFFEFFAAESVVDRLRSAAHGSVFDTITRQTLESMLVEAVADHDRVAFNQQVEPLMSACRELDIENEQLRRTRDELLPLLMSGAVRVRPQGVAA